MFKKSSLTVLLLFFLISLPLNAANLSFLIIESGLPDRSKTSPYSIMLENELFDMLFEMGHIVSNAPILQLDIKPDEVFPSEAERDFELAKEGGMEYFIIGLVDHSSFTNNVLLRMFNINSRKMLGEISFSGRQANSPRETSENIKKSIINFMQGVKF